MTIIIDTENFEEITSEWVTLVDFWAEWCWPCQMMLPLIDSFAEKMTWKVKVWKVNVDENQDLARQFRVMSIPTMLVFKDWLHVDTAVWVQDMQRLEELVWQYI